MGCVDLEFRIGLGQDLHRLALGNRFVVGGIAIPHESGPEGHSDGDVLLHAIVDALLGAAGLGDIGEWFPNTDDRWKDADSSIMVTTVVSDLADRGWKIVNLDCTITVEQPRITPHKKDIQTRLAELLRVDLSQVNVKAKSGEQVGTVGRQEAIVANAVVLLSKS